MKQLKHVSENLGGAAIACSWIKNTFTAHTCISGTLSAFSHHTHRLLMIIIHCMTLTKCEGSFPKADDLHLTDASAYKCKNPLVQTA